MKVKKGLRKEWNEAKKKNFDGYDQGVVDATEAVGKALDKGKSIQDAHDASYELGITGFMAGCIAQWIAHFHPRGEEFRQWWNKNNQIGTEGDKANSGTGVLNPALLNLK